VPLIVLAYIGGLLTIVSPCVLPVVPFVFARAGRPFATSTLPLLVGMAVTFALVASLAAVGGGWVVKANEVGRVAAMVLLAAFGLMLLWPRLSDLLTRPLVAFGNRLSQSATELTGGAAVASSVLLGIAVGFLWAPCAGPILGLILTGAAIRGANATTTLLLLAYAAGAATCLAIVLLVGGRVLSFLKRSFHAGEWIRRALGAAVLIAVGAVALGLDTGLLTQLSLSSTSGLEQSLVNRAGVRTGGSMAATNSMAAAGSASGANSMAATNSMAAANSASGANSMAATNSMAAANSASGANSMSANSMMMSGHGPTAQPNAPPVEGQFPPLAGAIAWLNSPPLTPEGLRGKVVLVDFWTYSCINCLRTLPYMRAWAQKYRDHGFVVIGVHTPEFAFEKDLDNVRRAVRDLKIDYPVAVDSNYAIWSAFLNNYWPADYFIDAQGRIRGHEFGEGDYDKSEKLIQTLLQEAGNASVPQGTVAVNAKGVEAAAEENAVKSPETYIGYDRAESFAATPAVVKDQPGSYTLPASLALNQWGLGGQWNVQAEKAVLFRAPGQISFRFHARDLHLVLGPALGGKPVRFRVLLDGHPPEANHGVDVDSQGSGVVNAERLYQLIRQQGDVADHTFTIEFEDPGVQAFSFTFG
jgi:cytochrome c biogenesis protein CcdA/thiol-disulfide isomerase/thioredoxin